MSSPTMNSLLVFLLCTHFAYAEVRLDLNDVSYLWPPVVQKSDAETLVPLEKIISPDLFQDVIGFASGGVRQGLRLPSPVVIPSEAAKIKNWHLVSMRIDPCAPGRPSYRTSLRHCTQEIRLVAQPFSYDGVWEYYDFALHIIFEMSSGKPRNSRAFKELLNQLINLKSQNRSAGIETDGMPLRVHPGFKRENFRNQLHNVILSHLKNDTLKKITFIGAESEQGPWAFFQGLIVNHHYQLESSSTLQGLPFILASPELPGKGGTIVPLPTNNNWFTIGDDGSSPSIAELFYQGSINLKKPAHLPNLNESTIFKLEDLVFAFDNPMITDRTNTDCVSCHASMSRGLLLGLAIQPNPFKYVTTNNHVTMKSILSSNLPTNFRTFGWFGSRPVVSNRVINESADVVDTIETLF